MIRLEGRYDLHVHPAPSVRRRRFFALEAIKLNLNAKRYPAFMKNMEELKHQQISLKVTGIMGSRFS